MYYDKTELEIDAIFKVIFRNIRNDVISVDPLIGLKFNNVFNELLNDYCGGNKNSIQIIQSHLNKKSFGLKISRIVIPFIPETEVGKKIIELRQNEFNDSFECYVNVDECGLNWAVCPTIIHTNSIYAITHCINNETILEKWIKDGCPEKWKIDQ